MPVSALVITYNCGRVLIDPATFASYIFSKLPKPELPPELLVLCLQEVAPIAYAFLGGSYLQPYLNNAKRAVDLAADAFDENIYVNIASANVGMTAISVFARQDFVKNVEDSSNAGVGVGLWEMGNKGAAGVRINVSIDNISSSLTFISTHLAAMESARERRNEDWANIARGLVFEHTQSNSPNPEAEETETSPLLSPSQSSLYDPSTHLFVAGDLNYRTASTSPTDADILLFPQPSEDESYPQHYWHLLSSDQLTAELKAGRTCQGLTEEAIDFPPTYKYSDGARKDVRDGKVKAETMDEYGDGRRWEWASHRWPSWCDRVLYRSSASGPKVKAYAALPLMATSDHRAVACAFEISGGRSEEDGGGQEIPFEINPRWKERRAAARRREVVVGVSALLTTTWEALWALAALVVLLILLSSGFFFWG